MSRYFREKPRRLPVVLTEDEAAALLGQPNQRYWTGRRDHCLLHVLLTTGLRSAEVLALTTGDIDWQTGRLLVRQGKGKQDRMAWLGDAVLDELRAWRGQLKTCRPPMLLFTTLRGTPMYASQLRAMVKRRGNKAGLAYKDIHPHTLRHTFASWLYRQTGNLVTVQKALGHSDLSTTTVYLHFSDRPTHNIRAKTIANVLHA
jgi:integrase/recombinase XerD